jgi:hypothetical protein
MPSKRLGGGKLGAMEIKHHIYFRGVDWDSFESLKVKAPWKPTVVSVAASYNLYKFFLFACKCVEKFNGYLQFRFGVYARNASFHT